MGRRHGRITKEDIVEAGFRRWDGRQRVTTDWLNVFNEPELQWPNGDILVYLREPGQSSRGPAFRVHSSRLRSKGFENLIQQSIQRRIVHTSQCIVTSCPGCGVHPSAQELYIPAPPHSSLDATFDHHITTRNFFAWIYNVPLVGRALGKSLKALKERLDKYRPDAEEQNKEEVITFVESQKYLDFRECVDHALAALYLAETFRIKELWVDAFAHCVGLSHRGLRESVEYDTVSGRSKLLIKKARLDLDAKLDRVGHSISKFFEDDLSSSFLGLSPTARDHLDRFRSLLHGFYIEQHGFWPPDKFEQEPVRKLVCDSMYSDFRNLYHHLADVTSSDIGQDADFATSGGVCIIQNVLAFDARHQHQPLPHLLPMLPSVESVELGTKARSQRRNSWNPIIKRKVDREDRNARRTQALIDSSNRDWNLMNCLLVRRYSEFESDSAVDDLEPISLAEGRKVRWIAIYTILQTLISVMEAPKQVRNIEGLSYPLCCRAPELLPWEIASTNVSQVDVKQGIEPDVAYSHTSTAFGSLGRSAAKSSSNTSRNTSRERRQTLSVIPTSNAPERRPSAKRTASFRRLVSKRSDTAPPDVPKLPKRPAFCEIYVPGYGNGLNPVDIQMTSSPIETTSSATFAKTEEKSSKQDQDHVPKLPGSNSVSRESSNASTNSTRSSGSTQSSEDLPTPGETTLGDLGLDPGKGHSTKDMNRDDVNIVDEEVGFDTVHFNTQTWDAMLKL